MDRSAFIKLHEFSILVGDVFGGINDPQPVVFDNDFFLLVHLIVCLDTALVVVNCGLHLLSASGSGLLQQVSNIEAWQ